MFCAGLISQAGKRVLVIDHAKKPAEKIRISGGGRCNFTNLHTTAKNFISRNPHFAKSALARFTPNDFLALLARHNIGWHEKTLGQLFCDDRSGAIIKMLLNDARSGKLALETHIKSIHQKTDGFHLVTSQGSFDCSALIMATGGLSIPKMGATGLAYDVAKQFGHAIVEPRPALVPFEFDGHTKEDFAAIAGVTTQVSMVADGPPFTEAILFTHRGLSGPAALQTSSYWRPDTPVTISIRPDIDITTILKNDRETNPRQSLSTACEKFLPRRLVEMLVARAILPGQIRLADMSNAAIENVTAHLLAWQLTPSGTEGWRTAEVTAGGVDTHGLSSKTMESHHARGLYFIGECVDVTGWLGGYNFQWAWASAAAAAKAVCE